MATKPSMPGLRNPVPQPQEKAPQAAISIGKPQRRGEAVGIQGVGGVGKTTLAALAPGPVVFIDLEDSLGVLGLDIDRVTGLDSFAAVRSALQSPGWDKYRTLVIDSGSELERLAVAHTIKTVPHDKGHKISRLEDYGYGKGYQHVYDTFDPILSDLDAHKRAGRNIVLILHSITSDCPNPQGEDYLRYEPRLQSPASGKASIRYRVKEWLDHLVFIGYDVEVSENGKGKGFGTRTIWPIEYPHCLAKSRTLDAPFPFQHKNDDTLWRLLGLKTD